MNSLIPDRSFTPIFQLSSPSSLQVSAVPNNIDLSSLEFHIIKPHSLYSFVSGFLHPAWYFKNWSMLLCYQKVILVLLSSILLYELLQFVYPFIYSWKFGLYAVYVYDKLLWTIVYNSLCRHMFLFLLSNCLDLELLGHNDKYMFIYLDKKILKSFPVWLYHFTFPTCNIWQFQLLHILTNIWGCQSFNSSHSSQWVVISHCEFNLHSLMTNDIDIDSCAYSPSIYAPLWNICSNLWLILHWALCLLIMSCKSFLCI